MQRGECAVLRMGRKSMSPQMLVTPLKNRIQPPVMVSYVEELVN